MVGRGDGSSRSRPAWVFSACVACLALLGFPADASAKGVLVFGPHPDDETFLAAGIARAALARGDAVKMVIVTNGDLNGVTSGLARQERSVAAAVTIGLAESDVIFLGYGDGSLAAMHGASSGSQLFTSGAGQTATYGTRGLGGMDYHRYLHAVAGPYTRDALLGDIRDVIANHRPDEIYAPSYFDDHPDHMATALLIVEAILSLQRSGVDLPVKFLQGLIWAPGAPSPWPQIEATGFTPWLPFYKPTCCIDTATPFEWARLRHVMVPPEMQSAERSSSLKWRAIQNGFGTYAWYSSFARREEMFWVTDFGANMATRAQVTVSSEDVARGRGRTKVVDGVLHGSPVGGVYEWATTGQLGGAWVQLDWPETVVIAQVNLHDRPGLSENVLSGTLTFSDGSSVQVGALPRGGQVHPVPFSPRPVQWVRFTIDQAEGTGTGLSELEALGRPQASPGNSPPHLLSGPGGAAELSVPGGRPITLTATAHDLDGDALQYLWWTEAGAISGSGPTATLTAPDAIADRTIAYSVTVLDGTGAATTNYGFLKVTPGTGAGGGETGLSALTVTPSSVAAGATATAVVTLAGLAPSGGQLVTLSSSDPAAAAVPPSVTVPAGAGATSFTIITGAVGSPVAVSIGASIGGSVITAPLLVAPAVAPSGSNLASSAKVSVSSESSQFLQYGSRAVDGVVDGYDGAAVGLPGDETREWATRGELAGAWIQLEWTPAVAVQRVVLHDRPNAVDQVLAGTIHFSDGSSVPVGALPNDARALIVDFPLRTVTWLRFTVDQAVGRNIGLAEIEVFGASDPPDALSVTPASVLGGDSAQGTVTLGVAAPAGGRSVALTSSNVAVSVPASVLVNAGSTTAPFPISTSAVASSVSVTITAAFSGGAKTALLTVAPRPSVPAISAVTLSPATVIGGQNVAGTVALTSPAGSGGFECQLSSGSPALAAVPASIVVPAGSTTSVFMVSTAVVPTPSSAVISAACPGSSASATVLIQPLELTGLALNPPSLVGGASSLGTFSLTGVASGATVTLTSSDPAAASVPASTAVALGASGGTFSVASFPVATDRPVTLTARVGTSERAAVLLVTAASLASVSVTPASVAGGAPATGTVTLSGPAPSGGATVLLSSASPAVAVPPSVTLAGGSASATFPVSTSSVAVTTSVVLGATLGSATRTATLTLTPPGRATLQLAPSTVVGGGSSTGTVTLAGAAPAGGAVVTLVSGSASAVVPSSVTVPAGATTAMFPITTSQVTSSRTVTISASHGGTAVTASLVIRRLSVTSLTVSPASVPGGAPATGTVSLGEPAAGAGFVVALSSSNPGVATVPATVTVPAGQSTVTFPIATAAVSASSSATISGSGGGATRSAALSVTAGPVLVGLTLAPPSLVGPGVSTGTVTLNGPASASGTLVTLSSSNSTAATVPSSVLVPAGATAATFTISARAVSSSTAVTITARAPGVTRRATLTVLR